MTISITDQKRIAEDYAAYLRDESNVAGTGVAELCFPETTDDVCALLRTAAKKKHTCTVSGGRTGILAGAVPDGSHTLVSLEKMNHIYGVGFDTEWFVRLEAGVTLAQLNEYLRRNEYTYLTEQVPARAGGRPLWYPVDPTEQSASIGGTVATNASGARSFWYGPTRRWVRGLTVVLPTGECLRLRRGENGRDGDTITLPNGCVVPMPLLPPQHPKNTAGYYSEPAMDSVDLFIGSEGTLGVVVEVELRLIVEPVGILSQIVYFPSDEELMSCFEQIRAEEDVVAIALEYFDRQSLSLIAERRKHEGGMSRLPVIPERAQAALYIECPYMSDDDLAFLTEYFDGLFDSFGVAPQMTWAGFEYAEMERMKAFRHAVPEEINRRIAEYKKQCPAVHKVSTDMAVADEHMRDLFSLYRRELANAAMPYAIFGHIGDNHLHVNMLPRTEDELEKAKALYRLFAQAVVEKKGTVAAEHGIGRLKKELLLLQYDADSMRAFRTIKKILDPDHILNPGVMLK